MSGLRLLSTSLLSIELRVQSKLEALSLAGIRLEFMLLPSGLGGTGLEITKIAGMEQAHVGEAALNVGECF